MRKCLFFLVFLLFSFVRILAQSGDERAVKKIMADQAMAWNRGSIDGFMKGYWPNDSLEFVGKTGVSYGYATALNNYKKSYSDTAKMGKLFFSLIRFSLLSSEYCLVTGKWLIKRTAGDIGGYYTLLFRKINGSWLIVSDHTS